MKKYLPFANLFALGTGALGMLLMLILRLGGTDEKGLFPASHPAWVLLCILTPIVLACLWVLTRFVGTNRSYRSNFPKSIPATLGCVLAAIGLLSGGIDTLAGKSALHIITGVLGIAGAPAMLWAAWCRYCGRKNPFPSHVLPCFYFALQLFLMGQTLGAEPEVCRYLFRFLAVLSMLPACYWMWGFDVNMGNRPSCLFWCLAAGYCNLVAAANAGQWLLHAGMALWALTALPTLRYLPKKTRPAASVPAAVVENAAAPAQEPIESPLPDADTLLDQLLEDYGSGSNS